MVAPLQARLGRRSAAVAAGCGAVGFSLAAYGASGPQLLLLPASLVLGAGGGLALASGLSRLPALARPLAVARGCPGSCAGASPPIATPGATWR